MTARKVWPIRDWPAADRAAWETAIASGDIFDGRGPAAHWSAGSRRSIASGYGRWIGYLMEVEADAVALAPAERVTPARVGRIIDALRLTITPAGVHNYVKHLYDAIRMMAPGRDWRWLHETARRLRRLVVPRNKRPRLVAVDRLWRLGVDLMLRADADEELTPRDRAIQFRDGLMIALLAARPVRRRNLAGIRLGKNLVTVGDVYVLAFAADETKNHQPLEFPLPAALAPMIDRYLALHRPQIRGAATHDGLWASAKGVQMVHETVYARVCKRTRAAFGHEINLHLFRDAMATTLAIEDPAHVGVTKDVLGHSRLDTTERYYNQARAIEAGRAYQRTVVALRRRLKHTAKDPGHRKGGGGTSPTELP